MISSSSCKKEDAGANSLNKSSVSRVPGVKPLKKLRFYLDVKNHLTSSKLETKIKELGGALELFLVKEVTHLVTDREGTCANSSKGVGSHPTTPQTPSNQSSIYSDHGTPEPAAKGRPKTRADAMLEKARQASTVVIAKDPFEQAKKWGVTIWSIEKATNNLERVAAALAKNRSTRVFQLKNPFVKIESFDRKHRPVFKEIKNYPTFNLSGKAGSWCLDHKAAEERSMTRKPRVSQTPSKEKPRTKTETFSKPGYCEVCQQEYSKLEDHLESKKHLAFLKDNANFLELDNLINDGSNVEIFLKLNSQSTNGLEVSTPLKHKMPRTRTHSICDKSKNIPISPTGSEAGHRLRRRTATATMTNSYVGSIAEDETPVKPEGAREVRELRSTQRNALMKLAQEQSDTWDSGRPKRTCIRQKISSYEDPIIFEPKTYYKIEPKSRGSAAIKRPDTPVSLVDDKSLVVKFKKMRSSELKQLNNEAENFLFPKRDSTSSDDDVDLDEDAPNTTVSTNKNNSTVLLSSELEDEKDERSMDSTGSDFKKKKKRLTQAESFIMDNKKYYKFETPGSRLRYQGSFMTHVPPIKPPRSNGESTPDVKVMKVKKEIVKKEKIDEEGKFRLDNLKFSFERVPKSEPWYQTFCRQDQGEEYYTCFSDSGYWKPFLLPYEMGPIPPLDPKVCMSSYVNIKKQLLEANSSGSNSASCSTPDHCSGEHNDDVSYNDDKEGVQDGVPLRKSRKRSHLLPVSKNPRKSPRQHASTLAILSSLIQQRKKREMNRVVRNSSGNRSLEVIPENEPVVVAPTPEPVREQSENEIMAKSIDDMLTSSFNSYEGLEEIEVSNSINMRYKPNAVEILEDYESLKDDESKTGLASLVRKCYSPGRKPGRKKKKKNRTGWPKTCRRHKKGVNSEEPTESASVKKSEQTPVTTVNNHDQSVNKNKKTSEINVQSQEDRVNADECTGMIGKKTVDLERWENAEKVLAAKVSNDVNNDMLFQPYVRVQKLNDDNIKVTSNRRQRSSSSPHRTNIKRARRMPASPKSPRVLRKPRGRWYRER